MFSRCSAPALTASSRRKAGPCGTTSLLCCTNCDGLLRTCSSCSFVCQCPTGTCASTLVCPDCRLIDEATGKIQGCVGCVFVCDTCNFALPATSRAFCEGPQCHMKDRWPASTCINCFANDEANPPAVFFSQCDNTACNKMFCEDCIYLCDAGGCNDKYCRLCFNPCKGATCYSCERSACYKCFLGVHVRVYRCEECIMPLCSECSPYEVCACELLVCSDCAPKAGTMYLGDWTCNECHK